MANPVSNFFEGVTESISAGAIIAKNVFKKIVKDKQLATVFLAGGFLYGAYTNSILLSIGKSMVLAAGVTAGISIASGIGTIIASTYLGVGSGEKFSKKLGRVVGVPLLTAAIAFGAVAGYKQVDKMINPPKKVGFDIQSSAEFNRVAEHNKGFEVLEQSQASVQKNHQNKITLG